MTDRKPDGFAQALEEDRAERCDQREGQADAMRCPLARERVFDDVRRGVSGRQRNGDDEPGGGEPKQAQDHAPCRAIAGAFPRAPRCCPARAG